MEQDSDFSFFAGRILLTFVYEETLGWDVLREGPAGLAEAHRRALRPALERGVEAGRVDAALLDYDLDRLAAALDPASDLGFDYLGLQTLYDRYLLVDKTGAEPRRLETPQLFWLRVAMGVCLAEEPAEREGRALELYRMYAEPTVLLGDPDTLQRRHASLAALELLPLRHRRLARVDHATAGSPRTRCARSGPAGSAARGRRCAAPAPTSRARTARARA